MSKLHISESRSSFGKRTSHGLPYLVVVILVIAAMVLPANVLAAPWRVGPQASAGALDASAACSLQALAMGAEVPLDEVVVMPADASAPMALPKTLVDRAVFVANFSQHFTESEAVEAMILTLFLMAGASTPADAIPQLQAKFHARIPEAEINDRVRHPLDEIVYVYMDEALKMPSLAPFTPFVWDAINLDIRQQDLSVDTSLLISQSEQRYDMGLSLLRGAPEYLVAAHECGRQNAAFAAGFNADVGIMLAANIGDSATTILQKNPGVTLPGGLAQRIGPDGTIDISLDELKQMTDDAIDSVKAAFDDIVQTIKEIDLGQGSIVDFFKNLLGKDDAAKKAKEKAEETEKTLKQYEQAIGALTTIFKQLDLPFANQFKVVSSSYLDVVKSVNTWMQAVAGKGSLDAIFSLSTVIMTGNVLGAVMNIVGIFGPSKPSADEKILAQIAELRKQIKDLQKNMNARFDRIDAQLNIIFTTMNDRFDQVDIALGKINGNIRDVQRSLIDLDLRLSQVERNNFELLNVLGRRPLLDAINSGLDYERVTGEPMPFQPEFVGFERTFHTWGTVHAFDPVNTGPSQRDFGDGDLLRELTTYPLDTNVNYLNGWLVAHGRAPLANGMLPSPRDWLLASRAYTQLGQENTEHMARIDPAELDELEAVGLQYEDAIARIPLRSTPTVSDPHDSIFSFVTAKYADKITSLDSGLKTIENDFFASLIPTFADPNVPFNLFGGADQLLVKSQGSSDLFIPNGYTKIEITDAETQLPVNLSVPASITTLVGAQTLQRMAEFLRLNGGTQSRITMTVLEENRTNFPCQLPLKPKDCSSSADVTVTVELFFGFGVWHRLVWDMGSVVMPRLESANANIIRTWDTRKADFDANAVSVALTPLEQTIADGRQAQLQPSIDGQLMAFQQGMYAQMVDSMASGPLHPLMVEIAGYKALLDAFTVLGLPRAIQNDEFLHAMLFGEQRLYDDTLIIASFGVSITQPITGTALLQNQRVLVKQNSDDRIDLYTQLIEGYLDAIANGDPAAAAAVTAADGAAVTVVHVEAADYLVSARHALDLAVRVARVPRPDAPNPTPTPGGPTPTPGGPTPTPIPPGGGGTVHVFLPLVDK